MAESFVFTCDYKSKTILRCPNTFSGLRARAKAAGWQLGDKDICPDCSKVVDAMVQIAGRPWIACGARVSIGGRLFVISGQEWDLLNGKVCGRFVDTGEWREVSAVDTLQPTDEDEMRWAEEADAAAEVKAEADAQKLAELTAEYPQALVEMYAVNKAADEISALLPSSYVRDRASVEDSDKAVVCLESNGASAHIVLFARYALGRCLFNCHFSPWMNGPDDIVGSAHDPVLALSRAICAYRDAIAEGPKGMDVWYKDDAHEEFEAKFAPLLTNFVARDSPRYLAFDASYSDPHRVAAVVDFAGSGEHPSWSMTRSEMDADPQPYIPGEFARRELPIIDGLFPYVFRPHDVDAVFVDGYCWLAKDRPGLGELLHRLLCESYGWDIPVIGVAKTLFAGSEAVSSPVSRHGTKPLYVTASGMPTDEAAEIVRNLHGKFRIPTMLKFVDRLTRGLHG